MQGIMRQRNYLLSGLGALLVLAVIIASEGDRPAAAAQGCATISDCGYQLLNKRATANREHFYVYQDADSAFNHSFPSGLFGTINLQQVVLDANCVDDPGATNGCSTDYNRLDSTRGTVFRFSYPALAGTDFVGLNWQEPENYNGQPTASAGYDLTPATDVQLDARSPANAKVQFGVGGCVTNFYQLTPQWQTLRFSIADLLPPAGPSNVQCPADLTNTHILFTVATNGVMSPNGGTVLLDNVEYLPAPYRQGTNWGSLSLPLGNQTFGTVLQAAVTPDQANRNLAPIYEAAATVLALLRRGQQGDVKNALGIADALSYALHHDNSANPLPAAPDGSVGLRSAYQGGDIALLNTQPSGAHAGEVRLAGFSVQDNSCGPGHFCLVLDGATGGNNAWAMQALLAAYLQSGDVRYLDDAETIGRWIVGTLKDPATPATDPPSYGGYFVGFADGGYFLLKGKSTENNGDIFTAFSLVARIETDRGNAAAAAQWQTWANVAGDFVMQMFDPVAGRFYAGTVSANPPSPPNPARGNCQTPLIQRGNDIVNTCDFLDSHTFTILPMAASPQYRNQIDWRRPSQYFMAHFAQTVTAGAHTYSGYNIVPTPSSGPNGVAWEFTGQAVVTARFIDALYNQSAFESSADSTLDQIRQAQLFAPFGDGSGLTASTLQGGDTLPPASQCLDTPFQCIPERVGLAATNWAIYADQRFNPLWFGSLSFSPSILPFPQQVVGTTSPATGVTVRNTALAAVTFSGLAIMGPNAGEFAASYNCQAAPLASGATCTINVTFTPAAPGVRVATLVVGDDALGGPQSISLVAMGLPRDDFSIQVSPDTQTVVAGTQARFAVQTQVTRGSAQPISLSVWCAPEMSCSLDVTNITAGGSATITVSTNVGTPPGSYSVNVDGVGTEVTQAGRGIIQVTPAAVLSPANLSFPPQQTGTNSAPQVATLRNQSPAALTISAVTINGAFASDFIQTNNCGSMLAAGASCTINVTFRPTGVAGRTATLFVFDNAGDAPQRTSLSGTGFGSCTSIADCGLRALNQLASANQTGFYVYKDADSGLNHGFPSGLFGSPGFDFSKVTLDAACIDDPLSSTGCTTNLNSLDAARGTVFRISLPPLRSFQFVGLNFQDPQNYDPSYTGNGYDLRPAATVQFDVRSPDGIRAQFGVGGCVTNYITLSPSWQTITIPLTTTQYPLSGLSCLPDLSSTNLLFSVAVNDSSAPAGGTVLLDNIQFLPVPNRQQNDLKALSLPVATETFGVVANQRLPIPPDQVNRNLATSSGAALTMLAQLQRRQAGDVANALHVADALDYALYHDNHGDPVPTAPQTSAGCYSGQRSQQCGLHSAYSNGDIAFLNDQPAPKLGQAGDVRLAGFSSGTALCGQSGFCLVLDGADGGDNAWALMALLAAYRQSGDMKYFRDATTIGNWIVANLADAQGYGGYFIGYNDGGLPKQLISGKSTTANAQIFAAFNRLAQTEAALGDPTAATYWTNQANAAANFVKQMFDATNGRFYAGTVNVAGAGTQAPGLCPDPSKQNGNDVINACDSLDSDTLATIALAGSYTVPFDWTRPVQYALNHFAQTVTAGGQTFSGFDLVTPQWAGQSGVAWEFTGQMIQAMKTADAAAGTQSFVNSESTYLNQLRQAQNAAPFGDGQGLIAATLQNGDTLPPYNQCRTTPFQCIPERVGSAATGWAVLADLNANPLQPTPTPTPTGLLISSVAPAAGRATGGQQVKLFGSFANLSSVTMGGVPVSWSYTFGTTQITVTTPPHTVGAVNIDLAATQGSTYTKVNAFAFLPSVFTDDSLAATVTVAKAQHIIELRQAVDALRAVAGLPPAPWTDAALVPTSTVIKAAHIVELRADLEDAAWRLGFAEASYSDPVLKPRRAVIKRIHIEELRQRIRTIAGS